jgi:hypothetical protein
MKAQILNIFRAPTPRKLTTRELVEAQRSKLETMTARD